eukprot:GGOE01002670.1.p1 GENE.GGOE01002670.1~~GGOE01002670.1.p1  ORF type:complete len:364 (+),score=92.96 GGOE01002670.1:1073-2164(+)
MQTPVSIVYGDGDTQDDPQYIEEPEKPKSCWRQFWQRCGELWCGFWKRVPPLLVLPLIALIVVGVFFLGAGSLWAVFTQGDSVEAVAVTADGLVPPMCGSDFPGLSITILVTVVKPAESTVKASVSYVIGPQYRQGYSLFLQSGTSLSVVFNSVKRTYTSGDVLQTIDVTEVIVPSSDISGYAYYPFDSYSTSYLISAYVLSNNTLSVLPLCVQAAENLALFDGVITMQGYVYAEELSTTIKGDATLVYATATFTRTGLTKFFSIFIILLMWGLSSMVFAYAIDIIFIRPREPAPPAVGFFIATLFALPAVRNVQPDAPAIGARVDVIGFFWNMVMVGLATLLMLSGLAGYHKYGGRQHSKYF